MTLTPEMMAPTQPPHAGEQFDAAAELRVMEREQKLHELLGTDYEYAHASGLVDMFRYNPETGEDGLIHTLGGEMRSGEGGAGLVGGFHHEPSADIVWGTPGVTRVDRTHLAQLKSKDRRKYSEHPYQPSRAKVIVGGLRKLMWNTKDGERFLSSVDNSMYPKEYDALAVLQSVRLAYQGRDKSNDELLDDHQDPGKKVIRAEGEAPMLEGKNTYRIKFFIEPDTEKIISAAPVAKAGTDVMKLSRDDTRHHLGL